MRVSGKELFKKFHQLPENLTTKDYRSFVFINYAFLVAGMFHFAFIWVFAALGVQVLSIFNILSTLIWIFVIWLNLRGYKVMPMVLGNIEVWIHSALCVIYLGWNSGLHYYILALPMVLFLSLWPMIRKIVVCLLNGMVYAILYYYSNLSAPLAPIDPVYLNWLHYTNILGIVFSISYLAFYYRLIVLRVENQLEIEHQKTAQALNRLVENLSDAADYVKRILPEPIPYGPVRSSYAFIPSESLGGDAFGYHWLDKDNFAVYLLDVSGHGVSAALLSATITNVLRSQSLRGVDFCEPDQVLSALNRSFPAEENNDMFFTIWYGVYNKRQGHLAYASGGHPPALLFSDSENDKATVSQLKTPNFVIGGMKDTAYQKGLQRLQDNACLYVFSDGVFEFVHADGSRWRYGEFAAYLQALHSGDDQDIDRLVDSVKEHRQSDIFEDDFTILKVSFH
jgi:sigma-B regulation protein RsbU (phosphoserine phosphatase)